MRSTLLSTLLFATILQTCYCLQSIMHTFTDAQLYVDLSTYNFAKGRNEVYEYTLTARATNKVNVYLFQNSDKQYKIDAFDGTNDQGIPLSITIPTNLYQVEEPVPITSISNKMFIRVTADQSDPNAKVDFQAVATDYEKPDGCGSVVLNVNVADTPIGNYKFPATPQRQCFYLIHANDPTNNPLLAQYIVSNPQDIDNFMMFKGLPMDNNHRLTLNDVTTWVYDKYVIVWPTQTLSLSLAWSLLKDVNLDLGVTQYSHSSLMTNDYYQDAYSNLPSALSQTMSLNLVAPMTSIQISYLKIIGSGSLTVNVYSNGNNLDTTTYLPGQALGPFNITYKCDKLEFKYTTQNRNLPAGSGFYGLYDDVTVYPPTTPKLSSTTTVESATKVAGNVVYSVISLMLFSLLVIV